MEKANFSNLMGFCAGLGFEKKSAFQSPSGTENKGVLGGIVIPAQSKG
jgi:hypothetical protein